MDEIFHLYLTGEMAPHMALMRLFITCDGEANARETLLCAMQEAESADKTKLAELKNLWDRSPEAYALISGIDRLASTGLRSAGKGRVREYRDAFDEAACISAEASVALYSLGDRDLLDSITSEIVGLMREWQLFDDTSVVAEIGCGTGRFQRFLAPHVREIVGIDISEQMLHRAAEQVRGQNNVLLVQVSGTDLSMLPDNRFDLVLAIDSFPYIVDAGAADVHFRDCSRILAERGRLLMMNFEYGSSLELQQQQVASRATTFGFTVRRNGTRDLRSWDGRAFLLEKRAT
jgi:SAM-dependent methyltransferase